MTKTCTTRIHVSGEWISNLSTFYSDSNWQLFDPSTGDINVTDSQAATEVASTDGHAALIGYAQDGYGMYSMLNDDGAEPDELDECRGHEDDVRGYHYHVAGPGENMFIGCFAGGTGSVTE